MHGRKLIDRIGLVDWLIKIDQKPGEKARICHTKGLDFTFSSILFCRGVVNRISNTCKEIPVPPDPLLKNGTGNYTKYGFTSCLPVDINILHHLLQGSSFHLYKKLQKLTTDKLIKLYSKYNQNRNKLKLLRSSC